MADKDNTTVVNETTKISNGKNDSAVSKKEPVVTSKATSSDQKKAATTPKKKTGGLLKKLWWLFILVLIVCLAATTYFGWQFWDSQNTRVKKVEAQLDEQGTWFATAIRQQSEHLNKQRENLTRLSQALENDQKILQQRLDAQATRLNQLSGDNRDGWMLEETRYLLRLANQRQLTGGGVKGIIGLLESADKLLITLDSPDVFPLRDSIHQDILALKIAPVVDREGIYLQLSALIAQVDQLPPVPLTSLLEKPSETRITQGQDSDWQENIWQHIKNTFGRLDQYVRIQHHDQPLAPLVSDAQQHIITQNLRLMLAQAQTALLREEAVIYQHGLEESIRWLNKHFTHFSEKNALVDTIKVLQQQPIASQLPDVSASLERVNIYIQSGRRTTSATKTLPEQSNKKTKDNNTDEDGAIKAAPITSAPKKNLEETAL